ncbi:hypothetical protein WDW86_01225 [Bdellovibrionota bacterium FG-2]
MTFARHGQAYFRLLEFGRLNPKPYWVEVPLRFIGMTYEELGVLMRKRPV